MKKIEAIIRQEKLDKVRKSLEDIGYPGMTTYEVKGHGKQKGLIQMWRGQEYRVEFLTKLKLEIVVLDQDLGKTLNAIMTSARTGEVGDGKIFVSPIEDAIRVRTGDAGDDAL